MVPYMQWSIRGLGMTSHFYQSHIYCKVSHINIIDIKRAECLKFLAATIFYMMLIIIVNGLQVIRQAFHQKIGFKFLSINVIYIIKTA